MCWSAEENKNLLTEGKVCFGVIRNINTGASTQLSPNCSLCPEGSEDWTKWTRPNRHRQPLPPTTLRLSTDESCAVKDHLTITPVSVTQDQGGCREQEHWEGERIWYIASKVIWRYVWQWAVGLWNASCLHLHITLRHLNILVCNVLSMQSCFSWAKIHLSTQP